MLNRDKITMGGQITTPGTFKEEGLYFYLILISKGAPTASAEIMDVQFMHGDEVVKYPVFVNAINPMTFQSVEITSDILSKYDVFYGSEQLNPY